jgi:hypothetical protein
MENSYIQDIQKNPFLFLKDHPWDYFTPIANVLNTSKSGNLCDDETFLRTFMSQLNIEYINNMIKKTVYNSSCDKYIIRDQNQDHLQQIMKGIYNVNAQHLPFNQKEQFDILNNLVIEHCVKNILSEINVRFKFIQYQNTPLQPLPQPINTSTTGKKSFLPSLTYNSTVNYSTNTLSTESTFSTIFDQKIIQSPSPTPAPGPAPSQQFTYQPYYFTDRNTNMYAKEKEISTNTPPTKFYNNPNFEDNSFKRHDHANYKSIQAPAPVNYFVPQSESTRIIKK